MKFGFQICVMVTFSATWQDVSSDLSFSWCWGFCNISLQYGDVLWSNGFGSLSRLSLHGESTKFSLLDPISYFHGTRKISEIAVTHLNMVGWNWQWDLQLQSRSQRRHTHPHRERETCIKGKRKLLYGHRKHVLLRNSGNEDQVRDIFLY